MNIQTNSNLNDARSQATKIRLVNSAVESLVEVGFTRTTGVEVCRRAQLTRGALNHHFPDIVELFISALHSVYDNFLQSGEEETQAGPLESFVLKGHSHISKPEFKAVIELWLASRNDPQLGSRLAAAIADGSSLFTPEAVLDNGQLVNDPQFNAIYRTVFEALIGLGLGRAIGNGSPVGHEKEVLSILLELARNADLKR